MPTYNVKMPIIAQKSDNIGIIFSNQKLLNVLEDDLLWLECIPSYENGKFVNINTKRLFSIASFREAGETYKNIFKDKYKSNFGEVWFLNKLFTILNRQNRLKEIGI
jgi:hypothetical protein